MTTPSDLIGTTLACNARGEELADSHLSIGTNLFL